MNGEANRQTIYSSFSLCGISGANGKARFSHKPCCGIVGHGGKYYLPLRVRKS